MKKSIWYNAIGKNDSELISFVCNHNFDTIVLSQSDFKRYKLPKKMNIVACVQDSLTDVPDNAIVMSKDTDLLNQAKIKGHKTALYHTIDNKESMEMSWEKGSSYDYLIAYFEHQTNIPLELLIARLQPTKTKVLKSVNTIEDMKIALGVMEEGSYGVLFNSDCTETIQEADQFIVKSDTQKLELSEAVVTNIKHVGMGHRVCIDTTSIMSKTEGMIIGSTSRGGLLISSETHYLPYMNTREFRVNAGAIHSYIWLPDNKTAYLSDLRSGDSVLCVDTSGITRDVIIGRIKIEVRPLIQIEAKIGDVIVNTIVQDDWHIRLLGDKGAVLNAGVIKQGDCIMSFLSEQSRHVGLPINEYICEK